MKISISNQTSIKNPGLFSTKTLNISKSGGQLTLKMSSFKLNIRPYNRLDKEVIDFKECKEELIMLYNTKYFY